MWLSVEVELSYLKLDGKYAISETRSRFKLDERQFLEVTRYTYKKSKGVWWVQRIDQTLKQEGHTLQKYVFNLYDFKPIFLPN